MTGAEARAIRRSLKLSARRLGELLGTTETSIYRWELRGTQLDVPLMYELALRQVFREEIERRNG